MNLSIAIVAMTENHTILHANGTIEHVSKPTLKNLFPNFKLIDIFMLQFQFQDFPWSSKEQGLLLSSFFYGM